MRIMILFGAAALALGGCEVKSPPPPADPAAEASRVPISQEEAADIVADMHAAFTSGDAFKIMQHYAPGAVVFDPSRAEASTDRAMQTKWAADFVVMKPSDLVTSSRHVQVLDANTIIASGNAAFLADVGGNRERLTVRYSQVFDRQPGGEWKIVHEHMSMPPAPPAPASVTAAPLDPAAPVQ